MLFAVLYTLRGPTEEKQKRSLQLFTSWKPPTDMEFKAHYARADGNGGVAIVEAATPAALLKSTAPFSVFFEFEVIPVVEMTQAVPLLQQVNSWRDSVR